MEVNSLAQFVTQGFPGGAIRARPGPGSLCTQIANPITTSILFFENSVSFVFSVVNTKTL
jgi:hypothetical protein